MNKILALAAITIYSSLAYTKIKVGVMLPLDGKFSSASCIIKKTTNTDLIDLYFYDSKNTLSDVVIESNKLIKENMKYIIGPRTSSETLALLENMKRKKFNAITIIPMASNDEITSSYNNTIRLLSNSTFYSKKMLSLMIDSGLTKNMVLISNIANNYSEEYIKLIKNNLDSLQNKKNTNIYEHQVLFEKTEPKHLATNVLKDFNIKTKQIIIYLPLYSTESSLVINEIAKQSKLKIPHTKIKFFLHGGSIDATRNLLQISKQNKKVDIYINNLWNGSINPEFKNEYINATKECNTNINEYRNLISFDAIKLIEKMNNTNNLQGLKHIGILGEYHFENRNKVSLFYINKINYTGSRIYEY